MTRTIGFVFSMVIVTMVCEGHSAANAAPSPCGSALLNGTYGFLRVGQTSQGPLTALGTVTFDGHDTAMARQTTVRAGNVSTPGAGSSFQYAVKPDCTGTQSGLPSADPAVGAGVFASMSVIHDGSEALAISMTPGNNVAVHYERVDDDLHRAADRRCSIATLEGVYGLNRNGQAAHSQLTTVGVATFDGHGSMSVSETVATGGVTTNVPDQLFTYDIHPDCTGTQTSSSGEVTLLIVVHDGGQVLGLSTVPGTNIALHYERTADPAAPASLGRICREFERIP